MRFADILELTGFADPWMVRANNNLFLAPFGDKGIRPNLLFIEPNSMSHGLLVWQGDGNGYNKRLSQMLNSASGSLSHEAWSMLWGPQGHRRPLLLEMPPDKTFDFTSPRFEMLALPEAERNRIKGSLPGADLDRLGLLPKGGANSK